MQIYKITNLSNGKIYIGKDEKDRPFYMGSGLIIKQAIKKYGKENFDKEILETCYSKEDLCKREKYWIETLNSITPAGYNISPGGNGGDVRTNHPDKKESIEKFRLKMLGHSVSQETREKIGLGNKKVDPIIRKNSGRKAGDTKLKRFKERGFTEKELNAHKLNTQRLIKFNKSEEGRKAVSKALKGQPKPPFTKEHRENIGKSSKGRNIPGKKIFIENQEYKSLHEASRILNIPIMTIRNRLKNSNFLNWYYADK